MSLQSLAVRTRRNILRYHHDHGRDRKSTRLNSSHGYISYAVFCLKKKKRKDSLDDLTALPATAAVLPIPPARTAVNLADDRPAHAAGHDAAATGAVPALSVHPKTV